jgi:hypothetical protein
MRNYSLAMFDYLLRMGVPVLSPYQLTTGVYTHDGLHHSVGVNRVYAHAVLRHLKELHARGLW